MTILFVTEFFPINDDLQFTGGVEAYNYYLIKELTKRHKVTVLCRRLSSKKDQHQNNNLKIIRIGTPSEKIDTSFSTLFQRGLFQIEGLVVGLKQDFDIVQGNNFVTYLLAFILGFIKNKPRIAWYPDVFIGRWIHLVGLFSGIVGEISERLSLSVSWNHIVALSNSTKDKLLSEGIKPNKISVIYAGVDIDFITSVKSEKVSDLSLCCISRLVPYKQVAMVVKAVRNLKDTKSLILNAVIVGDGPERESLEGLIKESNLENQISIKSQLKRDSLIRVMKSSQLLVHPSTEEGFGMVLVEAAAAGTPFLASDIPVIQEVTQKGLGGILFKKLDQQDFENKIAKFFKERELQVKLKSEVSKLASQYSWEKIAREFEAIYVKYQS